MVKIASFYDDLSGNESLQKTPMSILVNWNKDRNHTYARYFKLGAGEIGFFSSVYTYEGNRNQTDMQCERGQWAKN